MKKTLLVLAFASSSLLAIPAAFAQTASNDSGNWFINGSGGRTAINQGPYDKGHDTGYALKGGYRWALSSNFQLGAEVGYNDLGNIRAKNIFNSQPVIAPGKSKLHGWTAGATANLEFSPMWYVTGHAGLYKWTGYGMSNDVYPINKNLKDNSWYAGAGIGYNITPYASVGLNYDYFKAKKNNVDLSTDMISASVEVRF